MRVFIFETFLLASLAASAASARAVEHQFAKPLVVKLQPYVGDLVTLSLEVGGRRGKFLFDTGGGITMLTPAFAKRGTDESYAGSRRIRTYGICGRQS